MPLIAELEFIWIAAREPVVLMPRRCRACGPSEARSVLPPASYRSVRRRGAIREERGTERQALARTPYDGGNRELSTVERA